MTPRSRCLRPGRPGRRRHRPRRMVCATSCRAARSAPSGGSSAWRSGPASARTAASPSKSARRPMARTRTTATRWACWRPGAAAPDPRRPTAVAAPRGRSRRVTTAPAPVAATLAEMLVARLRHTTPAGARLAGVAPSASAAPAARTRHTIRAPGARWAGTTAARRAETTARSAADRRYTLPVVEAASTAPQARASARRGQAPARRSGPGSGRVRPPCLPSSETDRCSRPAAPRRRRSAQRMRRRSRQPQGPERLRRSRRADWGVVTGPSQTLSNSGLRRA